MAKQAKAKQPKARRARVEPTYLKGSTPLKIALHDIITALKEIDRKKLTSKFVRAAKKNEAFARIDPTTVNFVKDFFADNNLHKGKVGKHIVNAQGPQRGAADVAKARVGRVGAAAAVRGAAARDRFDCDFGKR